MDEITIDSFRGRVGTTLHVDEGGIDVELTEVTELRSDAFSVLFEAPAEPVLPQATYTFRTDDDTALSIFVVPLGPSAGGGMVYEAVFTAPPAIDAD